MIKKDNNDKALYVKLDHNTYTNLMSIQLDILKKKKNRLKTKEIISQCINVIYDQIYKSNNSEIFDRIGNKGSKIL